MNLHPYPNLRKTEKIKSTQRILQKDFYSVYLTHQLYIRKYYRKLLSQIVERVCIVIAFGWCSSITVPTLFSSYKNQ